MRKENKFILACLAVIVLVVFVAAQNLTIDRGHSNMFTGINSGYGNTSGYNNIFLGHNTGYYNATGYGNTAVGFQAGPASGSTALTNSTAIGYMSAVAASDTIILGGTGSYAVKVGIGKTTADEVLDVVGNIKVSGTIVAGTEYAILNKTASYTVTESDLGKMITVTAAGAVVLTLPSVDADNVGARLLIRKKGAGSLTITAVDSDVIYDSSAAGSIANTSSETYALIELVLISATEWDVHLVKGTWSTS